MLLSLLSVIDIVLLAFLIRFTLQEKSAYRLYYKCALSASYSLIALLSYLKHPTVSPLFYLILGGLLASLAGDYLLGKVGKNKRNPLFLAGMVAFLITHLFYITLFTRLGNMYHPALLFPLFVFLYLYWRKNHPEFTFQKLFIPLLLYGAVISCMLLSACGYWFNPDSSAAYVIRPLAKTLLISGACLFALSDFVLLHVYFWQKSAIWFKPLYLCAYNIGQWMIAISLCFF